MITTKTKFNEEDPEEVFLAEIPITQAIANSNSTEWYDAMTTELKSVIANDTWDIVDRPVGRAVIRSRMAPRKKFGADESLERLKVQIVARRFSQRPGIHFLETLAPVACLNSISLATTIASEYDIHIRQFNVTTAYLNGILDDEIFMELSELTKEILELILGKKHKESPVKSKSQSMLEDLKGRNKVSSQKIAIRIASSGTPMEQKIEAGVTTSWSKIAELRPLFIPQRPSTVYVDNHRHALVEVQRRRADKETTGSLPPNPLFCWESVSFASFDDANNVFLILFSDTKAKERGAKHIPRNASRNEEYYELVDEVLPKDHPEAYHHVGELICITPINGFRVHRIAMETLVCHLLHT
ncbi:hypothetical protein KM043_013367 [Ampulex compressa]|nr:hypothetical protein KM043_013367 [Ampulex compressa]